MDEINRILASMTPAGRVITKASAVLAAVLLSVGIIWAMGRAFDYECYIHSDEYFETTEEFGDAVRQYRIRRLENCQ